MDQLCISTNLTSAEWAAWTQAFGSILAIFVAVLVAAWQSRSQQENSLALLRAERRAAESDMAKALHVLSLNSSKAITHFASQLVDRESVHRIASRETYFDFGELQQLETVTAGIPLHNLPPLLVTYAMVLSATVRQFRQTIDHAIREHRNMDATDFTALFQTIKEMCESIELTCGDIASATKERRKDA